MPLAIDLKQLEELSQKIEPPQVQNLFDILISELSKYLELNPVNKNVEIHLAPQDIPEQNSELFILDFGVIRTSINSVLKIEIIDHSLNFLPLFLLREAYYCFIPPVARESTTVKICINQIVENDLEKTSLKKELKEWHGFVRDTLVDKDFLFAQLDRLKKYFDAEPLEEHQPDTIQHFFKYIHDNPMPKYNLDEFYDIIFEDYSYQTSRSLCNPEILETLRVLIHIFYETKSYLNLKDYQTLFKKYKENGQLISKLSLRKFTENMQWINKSTSIAPSYGYYYNNIDLYLIIANIKFNPLIEKTQIKKVIDRWPFFVVSKFSTNSFASELSVSFHVPKVYLKDFSAYFNRLGELGYIIRKELYCILDKKDFINLNYHTDITNIKKIIDPRLNTYKNNFEIEHSIDYTGVSYPYQLSMFDFILLDRLRNVSVTGLTFDKRIETLNAIKEDVENELKKQAILTEELKESLEKVMNSPKLISRFLEFLDKNKRHGFLYIHSQLSYTLQYLNLFEKIIHTNPEITSIHQFQIFLNSGIRSQLIEEHILLQNDHIGKISSYFHSKDLFREEVEEIQAFYNVLDACYNIMIIDLNQLRRIIKNPRLIEELYLRRKNRYKAAFKPLSSYKITNERIESTIEALLCNDPPVLKPELINTILISLLVDYYSEVILKDTSEVHKRLKELKSFFPRVYTYKATELFSNDNFIRVLIYSPNIIEKGLLLSILSSWFKDDLINYKRSFWRGLMRRRQYARDFYDPERKQFFYSEDLFKQLSLYSQKIMGDDINWPKYLINSNIKGLFWSEEKNMDDLVDAVKYRISHQDIDFNLNELADLSEFRRNLETNLLDLAKFGDAKAQAFFKRYIESIRFIPAFQKFGFSQYCLYFRPFYYRSPGFDLDFKLLFINSFQKIKYPACIEPNQPLFIEYIFPFRTPNRSYLNWLVKSKKSVSEYCLFYKKKFYDIIHFNRNLTKEGWNYSSIRFKSYMEDVFFDSKYEPELSGIREFDLSEISDSGIYGPETQEYAALTQIYNTQSLDIESHLGTRNFTIANAIKELLQKKLIFPYASLKNLDFQDKISIILPDITERLNEKILKIFSFFNVCRIYEIEGEFFIYGFNKEKSFENGLLIEFWVPKCELDEFFNVFDLLFQYLEIKHYIILTDLVNGKTLLNAIYKDLGLLRKYNPLSNLEWNDKDKIWMNHKLFTEKMEKIYPDLFYGKEDSNNEV